MTEAALVKAAGALALVLALASCTRVEQMRIHLDDEKHGSFVLTAATRLSSKEDPNGDPAAQKIMQRLERRLQSCGLGTALFDKGGKYWINARMVFNYPHEATSALSCAPIVWNDMDLQISKSEGLLWDSYTTKLLFSQPTLANPDDSDGDGKFDLAANALVNFPRILRVTVPGTIDSLGNDSRILGAHVAVEKSGPSSLQMTFAHDSDPQGADSQAREAFRREQLAAFTAGKLKVDDFEKQRSDVLALTIVSSERKFELKDLLSVIGVLFGSGFLLQLLARWLARRPSPAPGPPA